MRVKTKIKVFPSKCTGCRACILACSLTKTGQERPLYSRIQVYRDEFLARTEKPIVCMNCTKPKCVYVCGTGALRTVDGIVFFDEKYCNLCAGTPKCINVCPFKAIYFVDNKILKCDLCSGDPVCVRFCSTKAIVT